MIKSIELDGSPFHIYADYDYSDTVDLITNGKYSNTIIVGQYLAIIPITVNSLPFVIRVTNISIEGTKTIILDRAIKYTIQHSS